MRFIVALVVMLAIAGSATAAPWLYSSGDQSGTVGCVSQGGAYAVAQAMQRGHFGDWEDLQDSLPKSQWVYSMMQGGCFIVPMQTQWEELGADNTVAYMRLYPWDANRLVVLYFPLTELFGPDGNHPRLGGTF